MNKTAYYIGSFFLGAGFGGLGTLLGGLQGFVCGVFIAVGIIILVGALDDN